MNVFCVDTDGYVLEASIAMLVTHSLVVSSIEHTYYPHPDFSYYSPL
jgi:hypothetical protein